MPISNFQKLVVEKIAQGLREIEANPDAGADLTELQSPLGAIANYAFALQMELPTLAFAPEFTKGRGVPISNPKFYRNVALLEEMVKNLSRSDFGNDH